MESQEENWQFLNDIESVLKKSFCDKLRCIIFNIESAKLNQNNQILELSAIEIENFKIKGKIFLIHIKPRDFSLNNFNDLDNEIYCAYSKYWEYYAQDSKKKLQNFIDFIGNDSYLISHDSISDYYLLEKELKFWNLSMIEKNRFRSINQIGIKILELKKKKSILTFEEFCFYYKIYEYPNEMYYNSNLCNCMMMTKLFICFYDDFSQIYNKMNTIKAINIESQNGPKVEKEDNINKRKITEINSLKRELNNINLNEKKMDKYSINTKSINMESSNIDLSQIENRKAIAYISNSYNKNKDIYLYGGYISLNNKKIEIKGIVGDKTYIEAGAPGAEMFACIQLINKAIDLEIEIINIFSSYTGIKNFAEKVWSVKKGASIKFVESLEKIEEKQCIKLYFSCIDSSDDNIRKAKAIAMNADRINK